jgi:hypothetical protein
MTRVGGSQALVMLEQPFWLVGNEGWPLTPGRGLRPPRYAHRLYAYARLSESASLRLRNVTIFLAARFYSVLFGKMMTFQSRNRLLDRLCGAIWPSGVHQWVCIGLYTGKSASKRHRFSRPLAMAGKTMTIRAQAALVGVADQPGLSSTSARPQPGCSSAAPRPQPGGSPAPERRSVSASCFTISTWGPMGGTSNTSPKRSKPNRV